MVRMYHCKTYIFNNPPTRNARSTNFTMVRVGERMSQVITKDIQKRKSIRMKIINNTNHVKKLILLAIIVFSVKVTLPGQVVIQRCDRTTGWQGAQSLSVDVTDKK